MHCDLCVVGYHCLAPEKYHAWEPTHVFPVYAWCQGNPFEPIGINRSVIPFKNAIVCVAFSARWQWWASIQCSSHCSSHCTINDNIEEPYLFSGCQAKCGDVWFNSLRKLAWTWTFKYRGSTMARICIYTYLFICGRFSNKALSFIIEMLHCHMSMSRQCFAVDADIWCQISSANITAWAKTNRISRLERWVGYSWVDDAASRFGLWTGLDISLSTKVHWTLQP